MLEETLLHNQVRCLYWASRNELALAKDGVTVGVGLHLLHLMGYYHNSEKIMSMFEEESGREISLILSYDDDEICSKMTTNLIVIKNDLY